MRLQAFALAIVVFSLATGSGCASCGEKGSIQGRIASGEGFGQSQSALKEAPRQKSGLDQVQQALSLDGVSVDLLRRLEEDEEPGDTDEVVEDFGSGRWVIQETAEPAAAPLTGWL